MVLQSEMIACIERYNDNFSNKTMILNRILQAQ